MNRNDLTWLDKTEYPFEPRYFEINGLKQHYIEVGQGEILLFVHGTPSWSFDFRNVIKKLSPGYRCIAIDHIGFGLSDKPEDHDYSALNHSKTLEQFITGLQLKNISLVLHDFGGPIGLYYALKHKDNIKNIVVLNSWMWDSRCDAGYMKLQKMLKSPLTRFLYRYINFSARFLLPRSFGDSKLSSKLRKQYTSPFKRKSERQGTLGFLSALLNEQSWFGALWNERQWLRDIPFLFIWGMKDEFLPPYYLQKFVAGIPGSKSKQLETCGHFPQEEKPGEVAAFINEFLSENKPV